MALAFVYLATPSTISLFTGIIIACLGEGIRLWAIGYTGEPTRSQKLDAPVLVTSGPYGLVRNPLYLGNILNGLAVATAAIGAMPPLKAYCLWIGAAIFLVTIYYNIIIYEQEYLLLKFEEDYALYCQSVPALLPRINSKGMLESIKKGSFCLDRALRFERSTLMWQVIIWAILIFKLEAVL